ncbi:MAG: GntR family transcriptional regulator [Capsulimonadaceae bacterium]|nr:GntR family transcriptional regulator [Capsulimonadaceae bacterium]
MGELNSQPAATTIYRRIEQDLRAKVRGGKWRPGTLIPSRKALSREYGVDLSTVQRAIGILLADGTLSAENGRGTFVADNSSGNSRLSGWLEVQTIGLIVDHIGTTAEAGPRAITQAIHAAVRAASADCRIVIFDTYDATVEAAAKHEADALALLEHQGVAGAIVWHCGSSQTIPIMRRIMQRRIPMVLIDRLPTGLNCDFVGIDNVYSAREATEYLLSLGHRQIAFLAPQEEISTLEGRLKGYRQALEKADIPVRQELEFRPPLAESLVVEKLKAQLVQLVERIKSMANPPTAIFAANDVLAQHLIVALAENGLGVPDDMSVIGLDDLERYSSSAPFLTSMRQPFDLIGERAAQTLLERINAVPSADDAYAAYTQILLPTKLIERKSCRSVAS